MAKAQITGAIITSGQIEVDRSRQIVQHPDGGVVEEILVDEGDTVSAGDLLIRLDLTVLKSELAVVEGQLFEILARRARLEAERYDATELRFDPVLRETGSRAVQDLMDGQNQLFVARLATNKSAVEQLTQQRVKIESQLSGKHLGALQSECNCDHTFIIDSRRETLALIRGMHAAGRTAERDLQSAFGIVR